MPSRLHVAVFANGVFDERFFIKELLSSVDLIIAADGGAAHCAKLQIKPDILIGDFDSLDAAVLDSNENYGATIIRHPDRKDFTDLELALLHAKKLALARSTSWAPWVHGGTSLWQTFSCSPPPY